MLQYNGCKFKGGVLRVEKAKEHYVDRLRREWAEAEAEKAAKAKIAEKAAAMAVTQSRDMYSFTPDYEIGSESPERNRVELEQGETMCYQAFGHHSFRFCVSSIVCVRLWCVN